MLKRTTITLVFILLFASLQVFAAEIDLSSLSYDELVALRDKIDLAIWNSKEWQEVLVPQGMYEIGVDIPEGHWTITAATNAFTQVTWRKKAFNIDNPFDGVILSMSLLSKRNPSFDVNCDIESCDYDLINGQYIDIELGSVIFTPYAGKPSLGFK